MKETYEKMLMFIRHHHLEKIIIFFSRFSTYSIALIYVLFLIYFALYKRDDLFSIMIGPASTFIIVTIIRKIYNRPRPCINYDIKPLIGHKQYESFPSRHTASAFGIAIAIIYFTPLGYFVLLIAIVVGLTRILCGVHHVSDVFTAVVISIFIDYIIKILGLLP